MSRRAWLALVAAFVMVGCGEPPLKEYHRAQGALDAARAAGAERYAPDDYQAAVESLKQYEIAVGQRDYRLALNHALEAYNRAQVAAKAAANETAAARSRAEAAVADLSRSVVLGRQLLNKAVDGRVAIGRLAGPRRSLDHADGVVQKARKALQAGDYLQAGIIIKEAGPQASQAIAQIQAAMRPPPGRRRR